MSAIDLLVVIPPHASSMVNGPPLAPMLLQHVLANHGVKVELFDANARFFRWLLGSDARAEVSGLVARLLDDKLQKDELVSEELTRVGRYLTFLASDYCRGNEFALLRSGFDWAAVHEVLLNEPEKVPDPAFQERLFGRALDALAAEIEALAPRNIAFSVLFHTQCQALVGLSKRLRARGFDGRIIMGGAAIKLSDDPYLERLLKDSDADLAYTFNLYESFPTLAEFLSGRIDEAGVAHATYLDPAGRIRHNVSASNRVKKLATPLSYNMVDPEIYFADFIYPVLLSEGCYWGKCDFCDYPFLASQDPFTVSSIFRDPAHVVDDICTVVDRFDVRTIDLISDAVPMGYFPRLARAAGDKLRERGVKLGCSIRAEPKARAHHFEAMAACGVEMVTIGVESVCDEVLEGMRKGNTYADILHSMELARSHGIKIKANLIYDHPHMKVHHVPETLERLKEITPYLESLGVHSFSLTPHSPLAQQPESANLVVLGARKASTDHGQHHVQFTRSDATPELERALESLRQEVEVLSYWLERKSGGIRYESRVLGLPYRWDGDHACRDAAHANLMVELSSERTPFLFFVGEYVAP